MKTFFLPALKLSLVVLILVSVLYPLIIMGIGKLTPGGGDGEVLYSQGKRVGYALIGQKFTQDKYFWTRPSAVDFKADGSGGSNKGPSNPDYLKEVEGRVQIFLKHNPGVVRNQIPSELVTASGSGLDPDVSVLGAQIQVARVAKVRGLNQKDLSALIDKIKDRPLLGLFGPEKINVLKLNIALDAIQ